MTKTQKRKELTKEFEQKYNQWIKEGVSGRELEKKIIETMEIVLYRYQMFINGSNTKLDEQARKERASKAGERSAEVQKKRGRYNFQTNEKK